MAVMRTPITNDWSHLTDLDEIDHLLNELAAEGSAAKRVYDSRVAQYKDLTRYREVLRTYGAEAAQEAMADAWNDASDWEPEGDEY